MEENQIHCPSCFSTQITANKKGFSGKKAVAGAILTGGVGVLAGTIGSGNIKITCLACGLEFKPGQGLTSNQVALVKEARKNRRVYLEDLKLEYKDDPTLFTSQERIKDALLIILRRSYAEDAITHYQLIMKVSTEDSIAFLKGFVKENQLAYEERKAKSSGGCFVATACYGDYDAPEVLILRNYRDQVLARSWYGKAFIQFYYMISPPIADFIAKRDWLKQAVRQRFLAPMIKLLSKGAL